MAVGSATQRGAAAPGQVELHFELSLPPPKLKSFIPEAGRRHNKFNRNLRLAHEAGT